MNNDLIRRGELLENAELLIKVAREMAGNDKVCNKAVDLMQQIVDLAQVMPAVDAVEVVRCEKCRNCKTIFPEKRIDQEPTQVLFCEIYRCNRKPDEFCSDGERRKNNG